MSIHNVIILCVDEYTCEYSMALVFVWDLHEAASITKAQRLVSQFTTR